MLFGSVEYTLSVDLWAVGCVLGDLLSQNGQPLFAGSSDIEQLCIVFHCLGTPVEDEWPEVRRLPDYAKVEFTPCAGKPFEFEGQTPAATVELLRSLLRLNPERRSSASDALRSEVFLVEPAPEDPRSLVAGLADEQTMTRGELGQDGPPSDIARLGACDFASDDSGLCAAGAEYEPVDIETTVCSLWGDTAPLPDDEAAAGPCASPDTPPRRAGPGTPPPPADGYHRFKLKR